ncbi:FtsK/SpoIIIE domain-containing protein [Streptomyces sp. SL13]|uniref:FtsK/SpoIIIE domain-containing protein n=1 Tax=Streptantibioticus silvisoli TaxID=2705255 RepID=A0AA90H5U5_9ACTN|nr:FtsK/SpoIIIE domain-containing protein [Streptantibioticus silvisoli]MDI5972471.1 FtsK/SpoIIIE domain-containing protein [Streptantibioticus silvisoli]
MRIALSLRHGDDDSRDFLVDADQDNTVGDLVRRMGGDDTGAADGERRVRVADREVRYDASLREAGVRQGAVFDVRGLPRSPEPAAGMLDVGIASGPGAGNTVRLGPGEHALGGRLAPVPDGALIVQVDVTMRTRVRTTSPDIDARIGGTPLTEEFTAWPPDAQLVIADCLLATRPVTDSDAVLEPDAEAGGFDFNRPPRTVRVSAKSEFRIPAPPAAPQTSALPWVGALVPVVGALVTAVLFHSYAYLAVAALSPVVVIANTLSARRRGRRGHRSLTADYQATLARIEADIEAGNVAERISLLTSAPSAVDLGRIASVPESRLWERRFADADYLLLRVGTGDVPSSVMVDDAREEREYRRRLPATLHDVPLAVSLKTAGVLGVAGAPARTRPVVEWLLAQVAVLHSPHDAQIVLLTAGQSSAEWGWTAWLPHLAPAFGQDTRSTVGNNAETIGRRVAELGRLLSERQTQVSGAPGRHPRLGPDVVVVWDGVRRLRSYPGAAVILRDGPEVGIYSICVDDDERSLPEEATAVAVVHADGSADLRRTPQDSSHRTRLDVIGQEWFERTARALAPIRDTGGDDDAALPQAARLTEVLDLEPLAPEQFLSRWAGGARSTRATLGVSFDGLFSVDLVVDGPHGLVAGTTGAGKSELLQTMVASLAVANRPDAMNFVLVDYKGGAAFKDAVRLPHTVGMVTDLDAHLVERALTSLGAELTRREHMLAAVGAKDIDDYFDARSRRDAEPMPRLLIVIDEFASMVRELPDFVAGLVNIAQRGRSLGIHLILATQRPSGVVSGEIRANTNLRISLRVTDAADSSDIIGVPDAAQISASTPGRAFVRLGHASLIPFQTARVGGRSKVAVARGPRTVPAPFVAPLSWATAGYPLPAAPRHDAQDGEDTDLTRLVQAARDAAGRLGLPASHSPWLPPLPESVTRADLLAAHARPEPDDGALPAVPWALGDLPSEQAQRPVTVDLSKFGHLFIAGASRTGRSQALRTIAGSLADAISTADLHLFGIDMGNGALLPLTRLPQTGAVVQRSERERLTRLFDRLQAEMTRRQELFGRLGVADIGEQRRQAAPGDRLPHLVLLLDRWENFTSSYGDLDGGVFVEQVLTFLREGAGAGLHLVLAGDRSLFSGRIGVLTDDKWVLRFADRSDYSMANLNPRKLPERIPDGRMLRAVTGQEAQIALLAADPSASAQAEALDEIAVRARERDREVPLGLRPLRVDLLPSTLTWQEAERYPVEPHDDPLWAMIGVGGDQLTTVGTDLAGPAPTFLIAGPPRSGRSNLLAVMTRSLLDAGAQTVLLLPRRSPLESHFTGVPGVRAILTGTEPPAEELQEALRTDAGPVVLVIDDGELVRDSSGLTFLREWIRNSAGAGGAVVLGGNAAEVGGGFSGWQTDIRNNQRGALLSPRNPFDGDLLGVRLSRSLTNGPVTPGRALVHLGNGELLTLQVPRLIE